MQNIEEKITRYDEDIECLLDFIHQWEEKHPEEEMVFLTLPKNKPEERKCILRAAIKMLSKEEVAAGERETIS